MTQRQERRNELDQLIRNAGIGSSLMLQFKSPWPTSRVDSPYRFSINQRQHEAHESLANRYSKAVYYGLPLYATWVKVDKHAPNLMRDTWLMPLDSILLASLTSQSTSVLGRHRVDVERDESQAIATGHSPVIEAGMINSSAFFADFGNAWTSGAQPDGVPSDELQEWVVR